MIDIKIGELIYAPYEETEFGYGYVRDAMAIRFPKIAARVIDHARTKVVPLNEIKKHDKLDRITVSRFAEDGTVVPIELPSTTYLTIADYANGNPGVHHEFDCNSFVTDALRVHSKTIFKRHKYYPQIPTPAGELVGYASPEDNDTLEGSFDHLGISLGNGELLSVLGFSGELTVTTIDGLRQVFGSKVYMLEPTGIEL